MIIPVILSGGSGTRLWPLSRELYPKQLLALAGDATLLQQTARRLEHFDGVGAPLVICNEEHRFLVAEQLRAIDVRPAAIVLEPVGRNTAPAAAIAALKADGDALLLVLPADHLIRDPAAFQRAVATGAGLAAADHLVTFGITPHHPETGYGYIRKGEKIAADGALPAFRVERFVEKPDRATAEAYLADGGYLWNSGMFLFKAATFLAELDRFRPEMVEACRRALASAATDLDFLRLDKAAFTSCPADSIDYAVFEQTARAAVVPVDPGWSDIGSWSALWEVGDRDELGNIVKGDVLPVDCHDSYILAENRLVATVGLRDTIIVETADAVLVADRHRVQDVKTVVNRLKKEGRPEANLHRRVYRPWGNYENLSAGDRYQVKRITVNPGAILSLQMHHHRAEHWVVVKGTARITSDGKVFMLSENQSTYIPLGVQHRLENPGVIPLELIEVQSGSYLGEDDIVRFDDNYGRAPAPEQ
ncbi:MAG: mannose-1-phosphate guanylyltransferase/mannose-6-phosphate isomerase [Thermodesulfobacteriota bacterium]